jgi:hypothetical protein
LGDKNLGESNQIGEGIETPKNCSWQIVGFSLHFSRTETAIFFSIALRFRESAKTAFEQARKKLAVAQKKSNYEYGLVRNLEMARDVLSNANQTHLEGDLQQGCLFKSLIFPLLLFFCRYYIG